MSERADALKELKTTLIDSRNGYEEAVLDAEGKQIRAAGNRFGALPIVAVTANVAPEEVARSFAAGMNAHIGKPFEQAALIATIEAQLAARAAAG